MNESERIDSIFFKLCVIVIVAVFAARMADRFSSDSCPTCRSYSYEGRD